MKKILLIEDNPDIRETTADILELARYEVTVAADGKEGVETALRIQPDLIICDIMMPILDGYGVLHLLSKHESTAGIPFIFLTAKTERTDYRKGMEMGADDYITKPFSETELLGAIESRLKKADLMKKDFDPSIQGLNEFLDDAKDLNALKQLSQDQELRIFSKRDVIYRENSFPKNVFFLHSGHIKTVKTNDQGKEFITGLYGPGDFFGYLPVLEELPYSDTAIALKSSEVYTIPSEQFFSLVYRNHLVSGKFLRMLSNNLRDREEQLLQLAYNSVRRRIAEALLRLHSHYANNEQNELITLEILREDLANLAGTATETTIRTLSDFKQEGLIDIKGSSITILKYDLLSGMKN